MAEVNKFDVKREVDELRNQLALSRRIGFFLGAGASMSLGIPGIASLTTMIQGAMDAERKKVLEKIIGTLKTADGKAEPNVEDILNQVRLIRQLTKDSKDRKYEEICGQEAKDIDSAICGKIYEIILAKEKGADLQFTEKLMVWLNWLNKNHTKEIFTTNYDLIFERSLENLQIPYFDGFVGGNEPFFMAETVEPENKLVFPPIAWLRLWKLHGSLGWFWKVGKDGYSNRVVRMGMMTRPSEGFGELVIYPSKDKYESSRKQPFIAYFDRMKTYLLEEECQFIVSGYSFSDDHVNAILFNGLKENNRLHISAFVYNDDRVDHLLKLVGPFPNLSVYGPTKALIGAESGEWHTPSADSDLKDYWDEAGKKMTICGFKELVQFLVTSSGRTEKVEKEIRTRHAD
ncbi:MAG: SIR2 family protein [Bacteroidetes bacterium]|nr:SIR2 family protein [Bacteroidota bacterium]MCW5896713.1 SIR2 family protein [Bacteroidota bacterium]